VRQLTVSLMATWQVVEIHCPDGGAIATSPWCASVSIVAGQPDRQKAAARAMAARGLCTSSRQSRREAAGGASAGHGQSGIGARTRRRNGRVLGAGWPGVMLHEAVGHGLEGDFNRKQTSALPD
jgi:TldD protein